MFLNLKGPTESSLETVLDLDIKVKSKLEMYCLLCIKGDVYSPPGKEANLVIYQLF